MKSRFSAKRVRTHLTFANIVALLALVFAMTGGATAATDQVVTAAKKLSGSKIKGNTITTKQIKNYSLLAKDFKPGQLPAPATPYVATWAQVGSNGVIVRGANMTVAPVNGKPGHYCIAAITGGLTAPVVTNEYTSSPDWGDVQVQNEWANGANTTAECSSGQYLVVRESGTAGGFFVVNP